MHRRLPAMLAKIGVLAQSHDIISRSATLGPVPGESYRAGVAWASAHGRGITLTVRLRRTALAEP